MLSYSYHPSAMLFPAPAPPQPHMPQPQQQQQQTVHDSDGRFLETIREDLVTLDYLIGVALLDKEYAFVQYRPTEKHKQCAGLRIDPVQQINMFIQVLRDRSIPIETLLYTLIPSAKKSFWIRVSLADLTELSLEPLWMIKGKVQLCPKQQWVTITIDDQSLQPCVLNPQSKLLLTHHNRNGMEQLLRLVNEGLTGQHQDESTDEEYDDHISHSEQQETCGKCKEDRAPVRLKRKVCKVKEAPVTGTVMLHKRRKVLVGGYKVSPGSEPDVRDETKDKDPCSTTHVEHITFNRGMQTRMKSRQHQQVKRGMNTMYNRTMRSRFLYKNPNPVTLNQGSRYQSPQCPSSVPEAPHTERQASVASGGITPHHSTFYVAASSPDHLGQKSPEGSMSHCVSAAVEQRLGDPDSASVVIPSVDILPVVNQRSPLRSQPLEPQRKPVAQLRGAEELRSRRCLLM